MTQKDKLSLEVDIGASQELAARLEYAIKNGEKSVIDESIELLHKYLERAFVKAKSL